MSHLRDLQLRFQHYLIDGSNDIEQDINSTENALAEHRLGTYYNAYRIRLIDCLGVDYSALQKYLGREAFENLALDYLHHFPSSNPSVRWFGRNLPAYLDNIYGGKDAGFLREMARYEWAQTIIFDAADYPQLLQLEDVAAVPAEAWPEFRFKFIAALTWLDLHWNVPPIENALNTDTEVPPKQRAEIPQRWMLWRRDLKIQWRSLEVHEAWALDQAANGANFAAICEGLLEWIDEPQVGLVAAGFLKQWIADQLVLSLGND